MFHLEELLSVLENPYKYNLFIVSACTSIVCRAFDLFFDSTYEVFSLSKNLMNNVIKCLHIQSVLNMATRLIVKSKVVESFIW